MNRFSSYRRRFLGMTGCMAAAPWLGTAHAAKPASSNRAYTIAQVVDISMAQRDVSKDILIGARAAWQDINAQGGLHGTEIRHITLEVDGSPQSMQEALNTLRNEDRCIAVSAAAGERAAVELASQMGKGNLQIANVAPWLQDSTLKTDERTFPIFASRQEQIAFALRLLMKQGTREIAAVYATPQDFNQYRADIDNLAKNLKLGLRTFEPNGDIANMGQQLVPGTPVVVLFIGGTPEIISFLRGADTLRQRYIVALADVNLQSIRQLGAARKASVLGTQVVPVLSSTLPIVRKYKSVLARRFDEPPSALSLAGFISANYTYEVLKSMDGELTRSRVLGAFQNASVTDVGGFAVHTGSKGDREERFVAQSLLTADGRIVS
jgi:ABC-type branched-subunit amino acid transport system substrate-binding protein